MTTSPLAYFVNRKNAVTVVTLTGAVGEGCESTFEALLSELTQDPSKFLILNLKGLTAIESHLKSDFVIFQKTIRDMGSMLIICDLYPDLKKRTIDQGIIRQSEVQKDLMASLQFVLSESKRAN